MIIVTNAFDSADDQYDAEESQKENSGVTGGQSVPKGQLTEGELAEAAIEIRRYLKKQLSSTRKSLSAAYRIGEKLNEVKSSVPHGQWMDWLDKNTGIKIRTANQWMSLANHTELVIFAVRSGLTITEVLNQISELRESKSRNASAKLTGSQSDFNGKKDSSRKRKGKPSEFALENFRSLCELIQHSTDNFPDEVRDRLVPIVEKFINQVEKVLGGEA